MNKPKTATPAPSPPPPPGVRLVESQDALDELLAELRGSTLLAVDTEAASFHRYEDRVYLLQLSSRELTAVVDPLAVTDLSKLGALLSDAGVEVVFHDADYDLRLLDREYGFQANRLFDTRIAAQLLNEPGIGLAALLEKYLGLRLNKKYQRADWSARPLSTDMLAYAAADTEHLPELRDILRDRLEAKGRLDWAEEEFRHLETVRWTAPADGDAGYLRIKGAKALKGRSLAVLRALHEWRESVAKRTDRAAFRILNNEPMLGLARNPVTDLDALRATPGIGPDLVERRGRELLGAIRRALELPESKLPRIERPPRRPHDPAFDARLERLKVVRNRLAAEYDLAPGVLCPNGTLEAIARANPASLDELGAIPELRRWQLRTFGERLLQAIREPAAT